MYVMPSGLGIRGSSNFLQCVFSCGFLLCFVGVFSFGSSSQRGPPSIPNRISVRCFWHSHVSECMIGWNLAQCVSALQSADYKLFDC